MSREVIGALTGLIVALLGGGGIWAFLTARRREPIEQEAADIAAADQTVQMALSIANAAKTHSEGIAKDLLTEREARQELAGRFTSLETHVREQDRTITSLRRVEQAFINAWDDLGRRWAYHRTQDHPPERPTITTD